MEYILSGLSFLTNEIEEIESFLAIFNISHKVQFDLHLGFRNPAFACPDSIFVLFLGNMFLFPLPVYAFLIPQFDQQVFAESYWFPASSVCFLIVGCREFLHSQRDSLNSCQLFFAALSLKEASHGILPSKSLK